MRTIKIKNMSYEQYSDVLDSITKTIPYALYNQYYRPNLKVGVFSFWDVAYIPKPLKKYILQPPVSRENVELLQKEIIEAFKE